MPRDAETSAVAEHAWKDHHSIKWEEATVVEQPNALESYQSRKPSISA